LFFVHSPFETRFWALHWQSVVPSFNLNENSPVLALLRDSVRQFLKTRQFLWSRVSLLKSARSEKAIWLFEGIEGIVQFLPLMVVFRLSSCNKMGRKWGHQL
jgi:hypothetical protein